MEIAKGVPAQKYLDLNLGPNDENDWQTAISYLEQRLKERYVEAADTLIQAESHLPPAEKRFGFVILAVDCMLLETIQSFYVGLNDTKGKSKEMFTCFLTTRENFRSHFDFAKAETFYTDFRCGILHQTETKGDSRVWAVGQLVMTEGNSLIINRNEFHDCMKKELELYIKTLRDPAASVIERPRFKSKMDFICRK